MGSGILTTFKKHLDEHLNNQGTVGYRSSPSNRISIDRYLMVGKDTIGQRAYFCSV